MKTSILALALLTAAACNQRGETPAPAAPPAAATAAPATATSPASGAAEHGKLLIQQYGCMTCHVIPGIDGPRGMVGPSLEAFASRPKILDRVANTPDNLVGYLQNPESVHPQTSMPNLGISGPDARDIAAYLVTLK
jgi:cytochrome c2